MSSTSSSSRRARGSRFADGSSSTSRRGRIASTVAIATRRRWPSESWCGARSVTCSIRTAASAAATRSRTSSRGTPRLSGPKATSSRDGRHEELVVRVLEDEPDRGAQLAHVALADADAGHLELALAGQQAVEVQHQRRLAGAVGPEHRDPLAVRDVQVDAVEPDDAVRVAEAQAAGVDGAAHAATTRSGISVSTSAARNTVSARRKASTASRGIAPA